MKHRALQSYDAFQDFIVEEMKVSIKSYRKSEMDERPRWSKKEEVKEAAKDVLYVEWIAGGAEGGSCWHDRGATERVSAEPEPAFDDLETVVMSIDPDITHRDFIRIENLIQKDSRTVKEYYGNYTDYDYKFIGIRELYSLLVEIDGQYE